MAAATRRRAVWAWIGVVVLFLLIQDFVWHAGTRGIWALTGDSAARDRLAGSTLSDLAIFSHMVFGAVITALAVVQWSGPLRRRWPALHRISGRCLAPLAIVTGAGGLIYIALRGTIGGPWMTMGFSLYGVLIVVAALQTLRLARQGAYVRHGRWGLRLIVLVLGSWIYRVHYGLWFGLTCAWSEATCGMGSQPDFRGPFDLVQNVAFFLPYLLIAEWSLRRNRRPPAAAMR